MSIIKRKTKIRLVSNSAKNKSNSNFLKKCYPVYAPVSKSISVNLIDPDHGNRCKVCKRVLRDPFYIDFKIGKRCAEKLGIVIADTQKYKSHKELRKRAKMEKFRLRGGRLVSGSGYSPNQLKFPFAE